MAQKMGGGRAREAVRATTETQGERAMDIKRTGSQPSGKGPAGSAQVGLSRKSGRAMSSGFRPARSTGMGQRRQQR
jgi:hypothetical protein